MARYRFLSELAELPRPGAPDRVAVARERWFERLAGSPPLVARARAVAADPGGADLLAALFGNSPFLGDCLLAEPEFALALLEEGPDHAASSLLAELDEDLAAGLGTPELMRQLRQTKRRAALLV